MSTSITIFLLIISVALCHCFFVAPCKSRQNLNKIKSQGINSNADDVAIVSGGQKKFRLKLLNYLESLRPKTIEFLEFFCLKQLQVDASLFAIEVRQYNATFDAFKRRYPDDNAIFGVMPSRSCLMDSYADVIADDVQNELLIGDEAVSKLQNFEKVVTFAENMIAMIIFIVILDELLFWILGVGFVAGFSSGTIHF